MSFGGSLWWVSPPAEKNCLNQWLRGKGRLNFSLSDNFHPKIQNLRLEIAPILARFRGKIKILSIHISSVGNV